MVIHPIPNQPRVVFLKPLVTSPQIAVGVYSYYDDPQHPEAFESRNVLYHCGPDPAGDRQVLCFEHRRSIMNGAKHTLDGVSSLPFPIIGEPWSDHFDLTVGLQMRGDTVVGQDVWLGYLTMVMPGVHIGTGTIVASGLSWSTTPIWDWPIGLTSENVRAIMAGSLDDVETVPR
jgi:virginiamycin A acetyltransferase